MKVDSFHSGQFDFHGSSQRVVMPRKDQHLVQADHNRDFWYSFDFNSTPFLDWVVTGIFYEGVHRVEAFLDTRGDHSDDHKQRLLAIGRYPTEMGPIATDLEILKHESENARYRCYKYTPENITKDLVPIIDKIKTHIQGLLQTSSTP